MDNSCTFIIVISLPKSNSNKVFQISGPHGFQFLAVIRTQFQESQLGEILFSVKCTMLDIKHSQNPSIC